MCSPDLRTLDQLSARLPFKLLDIDQVNRTFQCWRSGEDKSCENTMNLWTYCYIRRYFLMKFMPGSGYAVSDLDALIDLSFRKVEQNRPKLQETSRYAQWVSVVCKNTFLNYLRARRQLLPLDDHLEHLPLETAELAVHPDLDRMAKALLDAIDRLPPFLREVAHLRFVEERSYEEIAARTGRPAASTRTYVSKILVRFRQDPCLLGYFGYEGV